MDLMVKEAFIKNRSIMNDAQVKYAIAQGQTVIMKLTYATGPEEIITGLKLKQAMPLLQLIRQLLKLQA